MQSIDRFKSKENRPMGTLVKGCPGPDRNVGPIVTETPTQEIYEGNRQEKSTDNR
jgi:hypothetical protein